MKSLQPVWLSRSVCVTAVALFWAGTFSDARAVTFSFEDLSPAGLGVVIPNGYAGYTWTNFRVLDSALEFATYGDNGYLAAAGDGDNVAFNFSGAPAEIKSALPFNIDSFQAAAAWRDGVELTVEAFDDTGMVFTNTYELVSDIAFPIVLNLVDIKRLRFTSAGGVNPGLVGDGTQFALDEIAL